MAVARAILVLTLALCQCHGQYPFMNVSLSFEDRVKDLVGRLTLDEMVAQISHGGAADNGPAPAISCLGIKPYQWGTECLSGDVRAGPATSFPQSIGMAASFNYDMVYKVARAISDEVRAKETYGEDPWLSGYLGTAFVTGLQGDHPRYVEANAGCKHFDVHGGPENIPVSRKSFDSKVTERDWHMTFLPQFKACVKAGSWSLMCSYNSINGIPACANKELLTDILREQWGFKGYVVSDHNALEDIYTEHNYTDSAVKAAADALNAGTCLEDGRSEDNVFSQIGEAVHMGLSSEDSVKDCASRLFMVRMKLGEFDPPEMNPYTKLKVSDYIQSKKHIQLSHDMATQTMVLLKNDESKGLPITSSYKKACVVGPFINTSELLFGDYVPSIMKDYVITPLSAIQNSTIANTITSATGCKDPPYCSKYKSSEIQQACKEADMAIVCLGIGTVLEKESRDKADIDLPGSQLQLLKDAASAASSAILVLYNANPLDISWAVGSDKVVAILESYYPAQTGGSALVDVLSGKVSPAGRLPNTWPASLDQVPAIINYTMANRTYRYFEGEPLFPFGYGLSYTTFKYSDLKVSPATIKVNQSLTVSATVKNTGKVASDEVVQVYISWPGVDIAPLRQLVGVKRVSSIAPSSSTDVSFTVSTDELMLYDTKWYVPTIQYKIYVGGQQPLQKLSAPSNILDGSFTVQA